MRVCVLFRGVFLMHREICAGIYTAKNIAKNVPPTAMQGRVTRLFHGISPNRHTHTDIPTLKGVLQSANAVGILWNY